MKHQETPSARRLIRRTVVAAALVASAAALSSVSAAQEKQQAAEVAKKVEKAKETPFETKTEEAALARFKKNVSDYVALTRAEMAKLGKPSSPDAHKGLTQAIVTRRAAAKQGDIFPPEIQPLFRRIIAEQVKGPATQAAKKAVVEGNPEHQANSPAVVVKVNGPYTSGASRSTVPASILAALPALPEPLQYLFVGPDLVLVDSVAQIIIDFIPAAVPAPIA